MLLAAAWALVLAGAASAGTTAPQAIWLDAGPVDGLVAEGFHAITPAGSTHAAVRWETPPWKVEPGAWPDDLTGDGLVGGRVHLDVPPGRYVLRVRLEPGLPRPGDRTRDVRIEANGQHVWSIDMSDLNETVYPRRDFLPGQTVWHREIWTLHTWHGGVVEAPDTGLVVAVQGAAWSSLVLVPADHDEAIGRAFVEVEARRRAFYTRHHDVFNPAPMPPKGPLRVVTAPLGHAPDPDAPELKRLVLRVPAGGRVVKPLWVLGSPEPLDTEVEVRGLAALSTTPWELVWRDGEGPVGQPRGAYPSWLAPCDGAVWSDIGLPTGLALEVRAPAGASGRHRGVVTLRRGDTSLAVAVLVDVVPGPLAPSPVHTGLVLSVPPDLTATTGFGSSAVRERLTADLTRMRRLGFDVVSLRDALRGAGAGQERAVFDHAARTWADLGGHLMLWADPKALVRAAFYAQGEAPPPRAGAAAAALLQSLVDDPPPVPVAVPMWEEELWKHAQALDRVAGMRRWVDAVAPTHPALVATLGHPDSLPAATAFDAVLLGRGTPLTTDLVASIPRSTRVWSYNQGLDRTGPWAGWRAGAEVLLQWHWNAHTDLPWFDAAPHDRDVHAAPGPDGRLWHSARVEAMSAGVQDVRVLATLEQRLQTSPPPTPALAQEARLLLAAARGQGGLAEPRQLGGRGLDPSALAALADRALVLLQRWSR